MLLSEASSPLTTLAGVGPATAARMEKLGVRTVQDLLLHLPREYEDRTRIVPLSKAAAGDKTCVICQVVSQAELGHGRQRTVKVLVTDGTDSAFLVCFGRPFLKDSLLPGKKFFIWGTFTRRFGQLQSTDFELEQWSDSPSGFGRILPLYPLTEGLSQGVVRRAVRQALSAVGGKLEDELPPPLIKARALPHTRDALAAAHFPTAIDEPAAARRALAYTELFLFELRVMRERRLHTAARAAARRISAELRDRFLQRLPFSLTADQKTAAAEIEADLAGPLPMARLLQGDVGCGKTLAALLSACLVFPSGEQAAFVAPTELLARQHAENAAALLEPLGVRTALLTGSVTGEPRRLLLAALKTGEIDIVFGTHALFGEEVEFRRLGLVIVDEQHKFGVLQREAIMAKGTTPDLLLMTATPIPRTLALTAFADLDVSVIRTMPVGRKPIITHLARQGNEDKVYRRVREEVEKGRQAYIVYPLIEESESLAVKSAEASYKVLKDAVFKDLRLALIHSRVPEDRKTRAMAEFAAGKLDVLVATSVVEVGVDVANATCIVVEHAERFGLSTLHQLRGRVGRAAHQSYAFLVYGRTLTPDGIERLRIMMETTDGFRIAERDLALRGPGELLGVRQSGFLGFRVADLMEHSGLLTEARDDAARVLRGDPELRSQANAALKKALEAEAASAARGRAG